MEDRLEIIKNELYKQVVANHRISHINSLLLHNDLGKLEKIEICNKFNNTNSIQEIKDLFEKIEDEISSRPLKLETSIEIDGDKLYKMLSTHKRTCNEIVADKREFESIYYPEPGKQYDHYKGGIYEVITLSTHTETNDKLVIYKSLLFGSVYARPLEQWFEVVSEEPKFTRFTLRKQ